MINDPETYGVTAETGLFIPFKELEYCPDILKAIRKATMSSFKKAHKRLTHFVDIHESGEATSRQCSLMLKYEDLCLELDKMLDTIESCINSIAQKRRKS
uniref:Four helix bundle protein n=1 Tax=Prevotella sp. GTC17262 TaxID=3236797 RepID=A0AB33JJ58_9BACT